MVLNMKNLEKEIKKIFEMNFYFNENFKIGVKNKPHTYCDIPSCASKIFNLLSNIDKDLKYTDVYELVQKIHDDYVKENYKPKRRGRPKKINIVDDKITLLTKNVEYLTVLVNNLIENLKEN